MAKLVKWIETTRQVMKNLESLVVVGIDTTFSLQYKLTMERKKTEYITNTNNYNSIIKLRYELRLSGR